MRLGQDAAAAATLRHGLGLADADPELARLFAAHVRSAERRAALAELHRCVDHLRRAFPFDGCAAGDLRALEAPCRALWEQADRITAALGPGESERVLPQRTTVVTVLTSLSARPSSTPQHSCG